MRSFGLILVIFFSLEASALGFAKCGMWTVEAFTFSHSESKVPHLLLSRGKESETVIELVDPRGALKRVGSRNVELALKVEQGCAHHCRATVVKAREARRAPRNSVADLKLTREFECKAPARPVVPPPRDLVSKLKP